jgi:RNA-dependent RNA polymerase
MSPDLKPKKWPHFMEKKHVAANKVYRSGSVLGKLYDQVELVDFKAQHDNVFDNRILSAFDISDDVLSAAKMIKSDYDAAMRRLMAKHAIRTEFEVWSIFVLAHNQDRRDYKFAEEFGATVEAVKDQYQEVCRKAAGMDLLQFVAAMYTVTARELEAALDKKEETEADEQALPLISFPWLFCRELGTIATGSQRKSVFVPQGYAKKSKRPVSGVDSGAVEVETKQGVTHRGELLELDFNQLALYGEWQSGGFGRGH